MRSSKQIAAAVLSVRCLQLELSVDLRSEAAARALCASALARVHLHSLILRFDPAQIGADFVDEMADRFVALRTLALCPQTIPNRQWTLPAGLSSLTVVGQCDDAQLMAPLVAAIAQLKQLESLQMRFNGASGAVDLSPLASLPSLTDLWLDFDVQPPVELAHTLRAMPALRKLRAPFYGLMHELTREPHQMRLEECVGVSAWTEEIAAAMSRVRTLTTIDLGAFMGPSLSFLQSFPQLSTLSITIMPQFKIHNKPQDIADSLCQCPQLTSLRVQLGQLNCAHWTAVLRALPLLVCLDIAGSSQLESLLCFADAPPSLSRSLTTLGLCGLEHPSLGPADVAHLVAFLRSLKGLQNLRLAGARPGLFDATFVELIKSAPWFPKLLSFQPPPIEMEGQEDEERDPE